ncbi:MAG: peptide deformylase [Chlamydiia bacterium]|nr:peptide deformylase [Chlamydiia bacterium]
MKLPLRYFGHPDLRAQAKPIAEITPDIIQFAMDLIESMIAYNGVGFAAPQGGRRIRIFAFRDETLLPNGDYHLGEPKIAINPILSNPSKETQTAQEGCVSVPGVYPEVTRPLKIRIEYLNLKGEKVIEDLEGHRARVVMHENDHLNGVLHIDRITPRERKKIQDILQDIKRRYS